jgi:hypothetical protein
MTTMKAMKAWLVAMAVVAPVAGVFGQARAIELRNEDTRQHRVKISSSEMDKDIVVRPNTLSLVVCVEVCEFAVEGVGTVRAEPDDVVTIRDGQLTSVPRVPEASR